MFFKPSISTIGKKQHFYITPSPINVGWHYFVAQRRQISKYCPVRSRTRCKSFYCCSYRKNKKIYEFLWYGLDCRGHGHHETTPWNFNVPRLCSQFFGQIDDRIERFSFQRISSRQQTVLFKHNVFCTNFDDSMDCFCKNNSAPQINYFIYLLDYLVIFFSLNVFKLFLSFFRLCLRYSSLSLDTRIEDI